MKGFRSLAKSDLRESTAHLSGAIRYLFDRASTTGKNHRLVIDLERRDATGPEVSDDRFYVAARGGERGRPRGSARTKEDAADEEERKRQEKQQALYGGGSVVRARSSAPSTSFDMSKLEVGEFRPKRARFAAFKETALKPVTLKKAEDQERLHAAHDRSGHRRARLSLLLSRSGRPSRRSSR